MIQYKQMPKLLQPKQQLTTTIKRINEVVELDVNNERMAVPSAEAYFRLVKRVAVLEQRLANAENKANRAMGLANDR